MPYSKNSELPDSIKVLPESAMTIWRTVFNENTDKGEESARKIAWSAVKNGWEKNEKGNWIQKKNNSLELPELKEIKGVEIFMSGRWNGDSYTSEDLDSMVKNFGIVEAPLKIGHSNKQEFSGQPAVGWIDRVYKSGNKLYADIKDVPKLVWQAMNAKAYKKISAEIIWDSLIGGKFFDRVLAGAAILGAELPAINRLADLPKIYEADIKLKTICFDINGGEIVESKEEVKIYKGGNKMIDKMKEVMMGMKGQVIDEACIADMCSKMEAMMGDMPNEYALKIKTYEEEIASLKDAESIKVQEAEAKVVEAEAKVVEAKAKVVELDAKLKEQEAKDIEKAKEKEVLENKEFAMKLVNDKKILPAQLDRILKSLEESDNSVKKEYSFGEKKEELTARDNLKKIYESLPVSSIFSEYGRSEEVKTDADKLDLAIKDYQLKNSKATYAVALNAVAKEHPELIPEAKVMK